MFYKTKVFSAVDPVTLETDLNAFLKETLAVDKDEESKLVRVAFSTSSSYDSVDYLSTVYTAMVLYKDYSNRRKGSFVSTPMVNQDL